LPVGADPRVRPPLLNIEKGEMMKHVALALLAALFWGMAPVLEKMGLAKLNPLSAVMVRTTAVVLVGLIFCGLIAIPATSGALSKLLGPDPLAGLDRRSVALLALSGILSAFGGQIFYFSALRMDNASTVVPIAATYPLVVLVLSMIFLNESVTLAKASGVVMIISGIWMIR